MKWPGIFPVHDNSVTVTVKHKCNDEGIKESKRTLYFKSPLLHHGYSAESTFLSQVHSKTSLK